MANNTADEPLSEPEMPIPEPQPDFPTDKLDKAIDPSSEPLIKPTENSEPMEVHHHAHHGHEKKTWKSYFWEFFMLFLAVLCGSLAEYQLEHKIEKDREKKYIVSLINDLVLDSVEASKWLSENKKRVLINDTILKLYNKDFSTPENSKLLYKYFLKSTGLPQFDPHTATLTQLKSSGSLRLIKEQSITDQILNYDQQTVFLQKINLTYQAVYNEVWVAAYPVLHVNLYYDSSYADYRTKNIFTDKFPPINSSQLLLDNFFGNITRQQIITKQQVVLLQKQIKAANSLAKILEIEYHLNNSTKL
jgi:hypothetical protein